MEKNLYNYLNDNINKNIIDFQIRAKRTESGLIEFYIHPEGKEGETGDFLVCYMSDTADLVLVKPMPPPDHKETA